MKIYLAYEDFFGGAICFLEACPLMFNSNQRRTQKFFTLSVIRKQGFSERGWVGIVKTYFASRYSQPTRNDRGVMTTANLTRDGPQTETYIDALCFPSLVDGLQQKSISFCAVSILFSITALLGNSLILIALHKESSLHLPSKLLYRCLATTDLLVGLVGQPLDATYWKSFANEGWNLCRFALDAKFIIGTVLCSVSLLSMTAISLDRLLALLLGLRYRQIVTLKRTYVIVAIFWVLSGVAGLCFILDYRITLWYWYIIIPSCIVMSIASYTKIFRTLAHHQAQIQDSVQQQPSQANQLNIARYKKAVNSAVWVQLALVVCYAPYLLVEITLAYIKTYSLHLVVIRGIAVILVYVNSTLNPFLFCWKIYEVRQAVIQIIRQVFRCPWS